MNKIAQGLIGATAAILLLAGCSAVSAEAQDAPTPSASVAPSAAPIPAQAAAPTPTPSDSPFGDEAQARQFFLKAIGEEWRGVKPTADQFLSAAALACQDISAGKARTDVRVVQGSGADADWNNMRLVLDAYTILCPVAS